MFENMVLPFAVLLRGQPRLFLEKRTEIGGVREIEIVGNFLDAFLCVLKQGNAFPDDGFEYQLLYCVATDGFG